MPRGNPNQKVDRATYERNKAMKEPAMVNVTSIAPILRFRFGNATTEYGMMLDEAGREASHIDLGYVNEYYDVRDRRKIKTGYLGAVGGVFYDKQMNVIDYWGFEAAKGGHNCNAQGIVTIPKKACYVRTNVKPFDENKYLGTEDGRDNWIEVVPAKPVYSEDISLDYALESGERFYRVKMNGVLTFIRNDYEYITAAPMEKQFYLRIDRSIDRGATWSHYFLGKFVKTDCKFDTDDRKVDVELTTADKYDDILAGMDKEYNLIQLAPAIEAVGIQKRPVLQLYVAGDPVLTNLLGNMNWEQEVTDNTVTEADLINKYKFVRVAKPVAIDVKVEDTENPLAQSLNGHYVGQVKDGDPDNIDDWIDQHTFTIQQGTFVDGENRIEYKYTRYHDVSGQRYVFWLTYDIYQQLGEVEARVYHWAENDNVKAEIAPSGTATLDRRRPESATGLRIADGAYGAAQLAFNYMPVYGRVLTALNEDKNENPFPPVPAEDIVEANKNYGYIAPVPPFTILTSGESTSEPTEWGRLPDEAATEGALYYVKPEYDPSTGISRMLTPIGRSSWGYYSLWVDQTSLLPYEDQYNAPGALRHTYPLWSCIDVLLKQIDPRLYHAAKPSCSLFLYGENNPIRNGDWQLFLTQNTNVKSSYYENPAQNAPVTLRQILDMLRDCFRCYWYIDGTRAFRIEHIDFFRNGGSYNPKNKVISYDITNQVYARNGKLMVFNTNKYSFDKEALPERYEFGWSNEVTRPFGGYPIEVESRFVEKGKIENVSISNITTDLDYMLLRPSSFSNDGLVLLAATPVTPHKMEVNGREITVSYDTTIKLYRQASSGLSYRMQNGELSFFALAPLYYTYDLPARRAIINEAEFEYGSLRAKPDPTIDLGYTIHGMKRRKVQERLMFSTEYDPNPAAMIRTGLGDGEVESYNVSMLHRLIEVELRYDTDTE